MIGLHRIPPEWVPPTLKISADRASLEELVDDVVPLFIYLDPDGQRWVRVEAPIGLLPGVEDKECPCCGRQAVRSESAIRLDVPFDDVDWWVSEALG